MSDRKTHSNAWYASLSDEDQQTCFDYLRSMGYDRGGLMIAKEYNLRPSLGSISAFYSKMAAQAAESSLLRSALDIQNIEQLTSELGAIDDVLRQKLNQAALAALVGGDPDQIELFMKLALDAGTAKSRYELKVRDQELKERNLELAEVKWQTKTCELFLEWFTDKRAKEIAEHTGLTNAQRIAGLRQLYFEDVDAAEKAGTVELPE